MKSKIILGIVGLVAGAAVISMLAFSSPAETKKETKKETKIEKQDCCKTAGDAEKCKQECKTEKKECTGAKELKCCGDKTACAKSGDAKCCKTAQTETTKKSCCSHKH